MFQRFVSAVLMSGICSACTKLQAKKDLGLTYTKGPKTCAFLLFPFSSEPHASLRTCFFTFVVQMYSAIYVVP